MKWRINGQGIVQNDQGEIICILPEDFKLFNAALIKYAPEMLDAIIEFCASLEGYKSLRNPKMHYDRFQNILERVADESE